MSGLFFSILNMSISAGILLLIILVLRAALKKMPKRYICILWAAAAIRLVIPFSLPQFIGLFQPSDEIQPDTVITVTDNKQTDIIRNNNNIIPENYSTEKTDKTTAEYISRSTEKNTAVKSYPQNSTSVVPPYDNSKEPAVNTYITNPDPTETQTARTADKQPYLSIAVESSIADIIAVIWLSGTAILAAYSIISYVKICRSVRGAVHEENNIYVCGSISTPFIIGFLRPKIYLPEGLHRYERELILAHEQAHINHLDHLKKPLAFLILAVYWFDPLVWLSYILFCRDVEIACDERVLEGADTDKKKLYATVLLQCSVSREHFAISPTAFGKTAVKERIGSALRYRQPSALLTALCAVLITAITAAACISDSPVSIKENDNSLSHETEHINSLKELQNEMYAADLSPEYLIKGSYTQNDKDRLIIPLVNKLYDLYKTESDSDELLQKYDDIVKEYENDYDNVIPYSKSVRDLLIPDSKILKKNDEETAKRLMIEEFKKKTDRNRTAIKNAYIDYTDEQTDLISVFEALMNSTHVKYSIGSNYSYLESIILGKTDPDRPRITLIQVLDIIRQSLEQSEDRSQYIYKQLCLLQKEPDEIFCGSGVYGNIFFKLAGKNESLVFDMNYTAFSMIYFTKTDDDGNRYHEVLYGRDASLVTDVLNIIIPEARPKPLLNSDDVTNEDSRQGKKADYNIRASEEAVSMLKYSGNYADILTNIIYSRYPGLTQEQIDKILILYDLAISYSGSLAYQISIAAGETDPTAPKLTLEDVKRIIKEAPDMPYKRTSKNWHIDRDRYNIMNSIYDIQYYPDYINGNVYEYWLDGNSRNTRTEEIVISELASTIIYNRYDKEGNLIYTETLFEEEQ